MVYSLEFSMPTLLFAGRRSEQRLPPQLLVRCAGSPPVCLFRLLRQGVDPEEPSSFWSRARGPAEASRISSHFRHAANAPLPKGPMSWLSRLTALCADGQLLSHVARPSR